jgi:hypothetical protein
MASRLPNYRQAHGDRNRSNEQKKQERLRRREADALRRKADRQPESGGKPPARRNNAGSHAAPRRRCLEERILVAAAAGRMRSARYRSRSLGNARMPALLDFKRLVIRWDTDIPVGGFLSAVRASHMGRSDRKQTFHRVGCPRQP